jgi:amidophosphoribosyltransferase
MCGIIGVSNHPDAARLAYLGLYALQHRGQESAGIVSVDDAGVARVHRGMGLVADVFSEGVLDSFEGTTSIGHTRYSTAGSSVLANSQPVLVRFRGGTLALAHNGNLTNAAELRRELVDAGAIFASTMDSEILVHLIARSRHADPADQIREALSRVEGAYSLVITVNSQLYAIVDPRGFRPLLLGKVGDAPVVASESCALDIVGARAVCELEPGSFVRIDGSTIEYLDPLPAAKPAHCVFELVYFSRPDSLIFGESVDQFRRNLGRQLAKEHPAEGCDCVFSVPDSSNAAALGFSDESGIPLEHALIRNHYVGRTFIHPVQAGRDAKVKIKYNPVREVLAGRRVVIVDDSIVRGTTSRGLVEMVRRAGAREVHFRVASAPIVGPCYYGIDTPNRDELIASTHSTEEIRAFLGVESLGYLSLQGMVQASARDAGRFCHACFSREYPTTVPVETAKLRLETGRERSSKGLV